MNQQLRAVSRLWLLFAAFLFAQSTWAQVVISQVYGGGGNTNAPYLNDFIEVFNRGTQAVDVNGWTVQYASATGTSWATTPLSGTILPGHYYLVKEAAGTTNTTAPNLPNPDAIGTINMSGTAGKVALVNVTTALSGTCPTGVSIIDFVGFGTTANCFEGTGPTPAPSNTTAVLRAMNGCADAQQNATDFATGAPNPRNSASPTNSCGPVMPVASLSASPTTLTGFVATQGTVSNVQAYTVTGSNLDGNPVSVSATTGIELSTMMGGTYTPTLSIPASASAISQEIFARLAATAATGPFSGTITNTANTTLTASITVSGMVNTPNAPTLTASPTTLSSFSTSQGTPSTAQSYTLNATNLTDQISISATAGFELGLSSGGVFQTSIVFPPSTSAVVYVRLTGQIVGPVNSMITNVSGSLTANVAVTGTVSSTNPYTSIAAARANIGSTYLIQGRVTVTNQLGSRQIYIQDETGGIVVYSSPTGTDLSTLVQLGDLVQARGPISVFSGYTEITAPAATAFTVVSGAGTVLPTPVSITPDQLPNYQGQLVSIANASITPTAATFAGGTSYTITAGGKAGVLRISANSPLAGAGKPANPVSVTGIADRFVSGATTPGTDGLQFQPRILADVPGSTPAQDLTCTMGMSSTLTRDQTLDIAAWNIEFFGADAGVISCPDGKTLAYANFGPTNEDLQQTNVANVFGKLQADIISVEEVSNIDRFDAAVKTIPGSYSYICSNRFSYYFQDECDQVPSGNPSVVFGPTKYAQKVCVIYNMATVTPVLAETKALLDGKYNYPNANNWSSGRLPFLFVANVTIAGVTQKVHVVALHAKSGSATADYNRRKQDVIDLKAELDANYSTAKIIILGDYNDKLNGSIATGQQSSYQPFVTDVANFSAITLPLENQGCSTFNSSASFIDHMIVSNDLVPGYVGTSAYVLQPFSIPNYGNTTSDHNPIESRFDLSQFVSPVAALTLNVTANPTMLTTSGTTTLSATVSGGTSPYSYTFTGPGTITPSGNTASVSNLMAGVQTFTVVARDATSPTSQTVSGTVSVTVTQANTPPVATMNANQTATVGVAFSYTVNAFTDAETPNSLTYSASVFPANGLSFDPATRIISGTPSMSGVSSVTVTATDPGGLMVSNTFTITVSPAGVTPPPTGTFSLTGVTTVSCSTVSAGERRVTFNPRYAGLDGTPVSFSVVNELVPTTNPGPYSLNLYTDNSVITLRAMQGGVSSSFVYNWLSACTGTTPPANTAPTVANLVSPQSATVGVGYTLSLANVFTDAETPNSLVLSVMGLPVGLSFVTPSTISGTPSMSGVSSVTVTATDPGGLMVSNTFTITVSPAGVTPPPTGTFSLTGVTTVSCSTVSAGERRVTFNPRYAGLDGTPVSFSVVNELVPTTNPGPYSLNLYTDNSVITLRAMQGGVSSSFVYNWLSACTGTTPPANTAPKVANPVSPQSATVGVGYTLSLANVFTDAETPNQLTLSVTGLPAGLSFVTPSTISGTPSMSGVSSVTVTATDPGGLMVSNTFTITVGPAGVTPPPTGTFSLTGVTTVSCETISAGQRRVTFNPRYAGLDGTPVSFSVVNELVPTTNPGPYSLNLYTDNSVITLSAIQGGVSSTFRYNWLAACTPNARLGAGEPVSGLHIRVLGNPVHQLLDVDVMGAEGNSLQLTLTDGQGRVVGQQAIGQAGSSERVTFSLSHLPSGILILRANTPTQSKTVKVIKVE